MESKTTFELADELEITPRQLDHWCRRGFVPGQEVNPGSGRHREFGEAQVKHLRLMSVLVRHGFVPAKAAELIESGQADAVIAAFAEKETT